MECVGDANNELIEGSGLELLCSAVDQVARKNDEMLYSPQVRISLSPAQPPVQQQSRRPETDTFTKTSEEGVVDPRRHMSDIGLPRGILVNAEGSSTLVTPARQGFESDWQTVDSEITINPLYLQRLAKDNASLATTGIVPATLGKAGKAQMKTMPKHTKSMQAVRTRHLKTQFQQRQMKEPKNK